MDVRYPDGGTNKCFLRQRGSIQEHINSGFNVEEEAHEYLLSLGQGSGCRLYHAGSKGRYRNQLGRPLHKATDGFEESILIG